MPETQIPSLPRNITEHHFHCQQKVNLKQTAAAGIEQEVLELSIKRALVEIFLFSK